MSSKPGDSQHHPAADASVSVRSADAEDPALQNGAVQQSLQQSVQGSHHGTPYSDSAPGNQFFSSSSLSPSSTHGSAKGAKAHLDQQHLDQQHLDQQHLDQQHLSPGKDDLEWSNFANLQEIQHLEEIISAGSGVGAGSEQAVIDSAGTPGSQGSASQLDLLNAYTNFVHTEPSSASVTGSISGPSGPSGNKDLSKDDEGLQNFGAYTNSDILQGGYANTANPPMDAAAGMAKSGSHSIASDDYTPLISPAVTPLEKSASSAAYSNKKVGFSPLTSPALEFQRYHGSSSSLRQKRRDANNEMSPPKDASSRASYKRSKTPNTTPVMGPVKTSSAHSSRRPSSTYQSKKKYRQPASGQQQSQQHAQPQQQLQQQQQQQQQQLQQLQQQQPQIQSQHQGNSSNQEMFDILPDDLMLPPNADQQTANYMAQVEAENGGPVATPATLMSFPISATISRNSPRMMPKDNVLANPHHNATSAHSSPVILPSSSSAIYLQQQQAQQAQQTQHAQHAQQLRRISSHNSSTSSMRTSPVIDQQNPQQKQLQRSHSQLQLEQPGAGDEDDQQIPGASGKAVSTKKINHKLAEQGRRNRMNVAIQELDNLIPDYLKDESMVPSKATTVELSSKFIRQLQTENSTIKKELEGLKAQLERYVKGCTTGESGSSISPLECIDPDGKDKPSAA